MIVDIFFQVTSCGFSACASVSARSADVKDPSVHVLSLYVWGNVVCLHGERTVAQHVCCPAVPSAPVVVEPCFPCALRLRVCLSNTAWPTPLLHAMWTSLRATNHGQCVTDSHGVALKRRPLEQPPMFWPRVSRASTRQLCESSHTTIACWCPL